MVQPIKRSSGHRDGELRAEDCRCALLGAVAVVREADRSRNNGRSLCGNIDIAKEADDNNHQTLSAPEGRLLRADGLQCSVCLLEVYFEYRWTPIGLVQGR